MEKIKKTKSAMSTAEKLEKAEEKLLMLNKQKDELVQEIREQTKLVDMLKAQNRNETLDDIGTVFETMGFSLEEIRKAVQNGTIRELLDRNDSEDISEEDSEDSVLSTTETFTSDSELAEEKELKTEA